MNISSVGFTRPVTDSKGKALLHVESKTYELSFTKGGYLSIRSKGAEKGNLILVPNSNISYINILDE